MTRRWNRRHQMLPNQAAKPCLGSWGEYPRSVESKSVIRSRHVLRLLSTSAASWSRLNHTQKDGNRKVETESQEAGVYTGQGVMFAKDQQAGASHPGDESGEYAKHPHLLPEEAKHDARKELRHACISQKQQRHQCRRAVDRQDQTDKTEHHHHDSG